MPNFKFFYEQFFLRLPYPKTSLTGKTLIVTGSNVGLGLEAARHFVRLDAAKVILAVRSTSKGDEAKQSIESSTGRKGVVEVWPLDLGSYDSVKAFADRAQKLPRLDVLLENAGIATMNYKIAEDNESTITVNVVSTFLLALLLLPKLRETASKYNVLPHLVIMTSGVHAWTNLPEKSAPDGQIFNTLNEKEHFDRSRYPISKLLEVLVVRELCARMAQKHPEEPSVLINMVDPGLCHSALARELDSWFFYFYKLILARSTEVGSRTEVHAAIDAGLETHGQYLASCDIGQLSPFVTSDEGKETQKRVYEELMTRLEKTSPGITGNI